MSQELILKEEVYAVVGAAMEVYNELGCGFLEPVYQEALAMELRDREIPFNEQCGLQIRYKGRVLNRTYCCDFICFEKLIVEIKALEKLMGRDESQLLNYLKATGLKVGVLLNFGCHGKLEWKRFVF